MHLQLSQRSFRVAGVGHRAFGRGHRFAWQAPGIVGGSAEGRDFVALRATSAACVCVDVLDVAKAWRAQKKTRGFLDVSVERRFRRTLWQADAAVVAHGGAQ